MVGGARIVIDGPVGPNAEPPGEDFGARSWVNTNADPSQTPTRNAVDRRDLALWPHMRTATHRNSLTRDVGAGIGRQKHGDALQILGFPESA